VPESRPRNCCFCEDDDDDDDDDGNVDAGGGDDEEDEDANRDAVVPARGVERTPLSTAVGGGDKGCSRLE